MTMFFMAQDKPWTALEESHVSYSYLFVLLALTFLCVSVFIALAVLVDEKTFKRERTRRIFFVAQVFTLGLAVVFLYGFTSEVSNVEKVRHNENVAQVEKAFHVTDVDFDGNFVVFTEDGERFIGDISYFTFHDNGKTRMAKISHVQATPERER